MDRSGWGSALNFGNNDNNDDGNNDAANLKDLIGGTFYVTDASEGVGTL